MDAIKWSKGDGSEGDMGLAPGEIYVHDGETAYYADLTDHMGRTASVPACPNLLEDLRAAGYQISWQSDWINPAEGMHAEAICAQLAFSSDIPLCRKAAAQAMGCTDKVGFRGADLTVSEDGLWNVLVAYRGSKLLGEWKLCPTKQGEWQF